MTHSEFDPLSLNQSMPQTAEEAILLMIRAWPLFEMALTDWLIALVRMDHDIGAFFIGRMDTRGKISKLREIYQHLGDEEQAKWLKDFNKKTEGFTNIRNMIVHGLYLGFRHNSENEKEYELIYTTHRPVKGKPNTKYSVPISPDTIKKTASFAIKGAKEIRRAIQAYEERLRSSGTHN